MSVALSFFLGCFFIMHYGFEFSVQDWCDAVFWISSVAFEWYTNQFFQINYLWDSESVTYLLAYPCSDVELSFKLNMSDSSGCLPVSKITPSCLGCRIRICSSQCNPLIACSWLGFRKERISHQCVYCWLHVFTWIHLCKQMSERTWACALTEISSGRFHSHLPSRSEQNSSAAVIRALI